MRTPFSTERVGRAILKIVEFNIFRNLLLQTLRDAIVFESEGKLTRALCLDLLKLYASGMETHATLQMV